MENFKVEKNETEYIKKLEDIRSKFYEKVMFLPDIRFLGYMSGIEFGDAVNLQTLLSNKTYFGSLFDKKEEINIESYKKVIKAIEEFDRGQVQSNWRDEWDKSDSEEVIKEIHDEMQKVIDEFEG